MRLSEFVEAAKVPAAVSPKVIAAVVPVLATLATGEDPVGWLAFEDDPTVRWSFLAPTPAGLVVCNVRVNVAGEGPRAAAHLSRWARVQVGEFSVEGGASRRIVSFMIDNRVLRGIDAEGDGIAAFAQAVFDAMDGRLVDPGGGAAARRTVDASADGAPSGAGALPELPPLSGL